VRIQERECLSLLTPPWLMEIKTLHCSDWAGAQLPVSGYWEGKVGLKALLTSISLWPWDLNFQHISVSGARGWQQKFYLNYLSHSIFF
jgi:hypothetical protein